MTSQKDENHDESTEPASLTSQDSVEESSSLDYDASVDTSQQQISSVSSPFDSATAVEEDDSNETNQKSFNVECEIASSEQQNDKKEDHSEKVESSNQSVDDSTLEIPPASSELPVYYNRR